MATNIATIEVVLRAQSSQLSAGFNKAQQAVSKSTGKMNKALKKTGTASKGIQERFKHASQSIAAVQGPLGPVAGRITSIGTIIGQVGLKVAIFTVAFAAMAFALRAVTKTVMRAETQFLKLEAILKATGNAAGLTALDIENLSREIGIGTLASTQKVRDAAGMLLTFKSIAGDTFREALALTQDLAAVGFGDLKMGAMQLGKALEEPIVGLGALRRVGVSFTEDQKALIKVLDMTGRKAEAQKIILQALSEQVGGAGVKAATGLAGAVDSLVEKFTLWIEEGVVGRKMVEGLTWAINKLADAFGNAEKAVEALHTVSGALEELEKVQTRLAVLNEKVMWNHEASLIYAHEIEKLVEKEKQLLQSIIEIEKFERESKRIINANKVEDAVKKITEAEKETKTAMDSVRRANKRQIEDLGKTRQELALINSLRKIEDKLRSKLGEHALTEAEINKQLKIHKEELIRITAETERLVRVQANIDAFIGVATRGFDNLAESIASAMITGQKEGLKFKEILRALAIDLTKTMLQVMIFNQLKEGATKFGNTFLKGILSGGTTPSNVGNPMNYRQHGGEVSSIPHIVGEKGPELFVPNTSGKIIPNNQLGKSGGGGININQNLNFTTGIQNTVRAEVMNMLPAIQNATLSAVADAKMRGGKFSKAFGG